MAEGLVCNMLGRMMHVLTFDNASKKRVEYEIIQDWRSTWTRWDGLILLKLKQGRQNSSMLLKVGRWRVA